MRIGRDEMRWRDVVFRLPVQMLTGQGPSQDSCSARAQRDLDTSVDMARGSREGCRRQARCIQAAMPPCDWMHPKCSTTEASMEMGAIVRDASDLSHGLTLESKWKLIPKTPTGHTIRTHKSKHYFSEPTLHSFDCRSVSSSH